MLQLLHRCPIVPPFDLARAINVDVRFPLVDFLCLDPAFALHLPDCWEDSGTFETLDLRIRKKFFPLH